MFAPHIRGRRRCLDQAKKVELCDLVHHGATVEEAADTIGVSLRTVQREVKLDEDFDHELKLALGGAPDPLKLMQRAARAHWRAAAWLLERTDPEHYSKRPKSSATPEQFEGALGFMLEAALEATPPEARAAVFKRMQAAREQAFKCVFPNYGPWGRPKNPKLPPTPPAHAERVKSVLDTSSRFHVYDIDDDPAEAPSTPAIEESHHHIEFSGPLPPEGRDGEGVEAGTRSADSSDAPRVPAESPLPGAAHELPRVRSDDFGSPVLPLLPPRRGEGTGRTKRRRRDHASTLKRNRRPARSIKPRRPNVSRDNNRFLSPKTRITTKRNPNDAPPNKTPVSREAAAEREPRTQSQPTSALTPS